MLPSEIKRKAVELLVKQDFGGRYGLCFLNLTRLKIGHGSFVTTVGEFNRTFPDNRIKTGGLCSGAMVTYAGSHFIFYDPSADGDGAVPLLHEAGHVILGHRASGGRDSETEDEAELFAYEFLMPECVVRYLDALNGEPLAPREFGAYFRGTLRDHFARRLQISERAPAAADENETEILRRLFAAKG